MDETFSFGKGAAALSEACEDSGVDGYYFAITKDSDPEDEADEWDNDETHRVSLAEMRDAVERMKNKGRMQIYDNDIGYLFTKEAARLVVMDATRGKTASRYEIIPEEEVDTEYDYKNMKPPHTRTYEEEPQGMSWKEYDDTLRESNRETVRDLQKMILRALEGSN